MLESRFKLLIPVALVAVTLQVLVGLGGGCGSAARELEGSSGDGGDGGGSDAGQAPGLGDASVDAEDARDGSCPETDPCWVRIDEGPDYCVFEEARNPRATFEPRWVPCDPPKDCLKLQLESTNETSYHVLQGPVFSSAEPVFGVAIENRESPARQRVLVLTSVDRVSAAWRSDVTEDSATCGFGTPSSGYGNLVVGLGAVHEAQPEELYSKVLIETEERGREVVDFPNLLVGVSMSANIIVAIANFTFETFVFVDGEFVPMAEPGAISESGAWTHVAGQHVFWLDVTFPDNRFVVHTKLEAQPNLVVPARTDGTRIQDFRTDGRTMAWVVAPTTGRGPQEIWTAPFATNEEDVRPRRVATIPDGAWAQVGPDRYTLTGAEAIYVLTLSTGELRTFDYGAPGLTLFATHVMWVTEEELALYYQRNDDGDTVLRRIDITSLPPFDPPD